MTGKKQKVKINKELTQRKASMSPMKTKPIQKGPELFLPKFIIPNQKEKV